MHKRRINLVEGIVPQLNATYYLATLRQLTFQLGETYNQMIDLKLSGTKQMTPLKAVKVNKLYSSVFFVLTILELLKP
jgi:hypothetical protein